VTGPTSQPDADEPRPWERSGAARRNCVPHRGPLLRLLGTAAVLYAVAALTLPCLAVIPRGLLVFVPLWLGGLASAVAVLTLARRDLALMAAGRMDPAGRPATATARDRATNAAALSFLVLVIGAGLLVARFWH
jgi:hypothetical protein